MTPPAIPQRGATYAYSIRNSAAHGSAKTACWQQRNGFGHYRASRITRFYRRRIPFFHLYNIRLRTLYNIHRLLSTLHSPPNIFLRIWRVGDIVDINVTL